MWLATAFCAAAAAAPVNALAANVTSSADTMTSGTLRFEIANAGPGATITINPGVNPVLSSGTAIGITQNITLVGQGMGQTTITGSSTDRVFTVALGSGSQTVTIRNLTITGGHAPSATSPGNPGASGGGIFVTTGGLVIDSVEFAGNAAGDGAAGAAGSNASGTGTGGTGHSGGNGGEGGAIISAGDLTVNNSSFHGNSAGAAGSGGTGGNGAGGFPGGPGGPGGVGGVGGAIVTFSAPQITNTSFANNQAGNGGAGGAGNGGGFGANGGAGGLGGSGGAVYQGPITPVMPIQGSTFSGNVAGAGGAGGAGTGLGGAGAAGQGGDGGGAFVLNSSVVNSTFNANRAGAGGLGGTSAFGTNVGGIGGNGGGLTGTWSTDFSTFAGNAAGLGGTPGGTSGTGGGVHSFIARPLTASIVSNNIAAGSASDAGANCGGTPPNAANDLSFPAGTGCPGANGDPLLSPLAANGGATLTMALNPGSAAIDKVPVAPCDVTTDQRGVTRPQGSSCDAGAFELVPAPPTPTVSTPNHTVSKKCKKKKRKHRSASTAKKKKHCKKKKRRK